MKKLFGKILVGAIGCVMALGINAFAANEIKDITITPDKGTGKVTISGTITGDAASPESTILVAPEGVSLIDVTDANIKYIDQETVEAGTFKYEFTLTKGVKYNVWFGGTDIAATKDDIIDLTAAEDDPKPPVGGKYKIVGTVSLLNGADVSKVTVTAGDETVNVDKATSQYTLEVESGTYDVVVGRAGYLYKTYDGVVVEDNVDLGAITLLAGDIVDYGKADSIIDLGDLQPLLMVYNSSEGSEDYNADADLNDDKVIDLIDLQALLSNYNANSNAYAAE